jgi:hypothetical protein
MTTTPTILIATPCYGGLVTNHYLMSILGMTRLMSERRIGYDVRTLSDSLITRARNTIASDFLEQTQFSHLFFIDADLGFDPAAVLRYLAFGKELVCGVYPLKRLDIGAIRASDAGDAVAEAASYIYSSPISAHDGNQPENGFLRTEYAATGFMLIQRSALERMAGAYPELRYRSDRIVSASSAGTRYAFFDTMIADGESLPEDYSFCKRWRALGGEIWIDLESRFSHVGNYVFKGDLALAIGEACRLGTARPAA